MQGIVQSYGSKAGDIDFTDGSIGISPSFQVRV
jgi:hypothetical protein